MGEVLRAFSELGYFGAWTVLDAQWFGVAQRRRRVFGVFTRLDSGSACCAEILSLAEGMRWHPAPSRETGSDPTGTISARTKGGGGLGGDFERQGGLQVVHTLKGEGFDASEDGTGRGVPIIPQETACSLTGNRYGDHESRNDILIPETAWCLQERDSKGSDSNTKPGHLIPIAFSGKDSGADAGEISPTLRSMNFKDSHLNGGGQVSVCAREVAQALTSNYGKQADNSDTALGPTLAFNLRGRDAGANVELCDKASLRASSGGSSRSYVGVRRLTPTECERLQGFPDGWTAGFSDSTRYRMLGNAVAVPCAEWIGKRLTKQ
jgi:DNA (cytosine-5)-methyltransferase 1